MLEKKGIIVVPDLSLQISPPKIDPSSSSPYNSSSSFSFDAWQQSRIPPQVDTELSLSNNSTAEVDMSTDRFRPIRGIPVYSNGLVSSSTYNLINNQNQTTSSSLLSPPLSSTFRAFQQQEQQPVARFNGITMEALRNHQQNQNQFVVQNHHHQHHQSPHFGVSDFSCSNNRSRFFMPRIQSRRNARAPRMRWTSSLHARFIRAVQLLGGHERATPKSVLELMDVKDLTLAHVKSHLQMYRTVKNTDKQTASSEGSGEEDFLPATPTPHHEANCLVNQRREFTAAAASSLDLDVNASTPPSINNSSRRAWEQGSPRSASLFGSEIQQEENYDQLDHPNSLMELNLNLNSPSKELSMRHNWQN